MGSMIMSIGSSVVAGLTGVPSIQTDRHTDHGTCDMCSKGPNICDECDADWLRKLEIIYLGPIVNGRASFQRFNPEFLGISF